MKRYSINVIVALVMGILSSCQDFLNRPPLGQLTEINFMLSESDAILATNAIYNTNREWFITGGFPLMDIMSDDANKGSNPSDASQLIPFDNFTFNPSEVLISNMYATLYKGIRRANLVIEKAPAITMNESLKSRLIAEARFLRALYYFDLVRTFGDIPKITVTIPPRKIARSPKAEIYQEIIIADLIFATQNLPERSEYPSDDLGRATKGAAKGLLAKVYLFQKDFVNAEKYALEVINSGQYTLEPDFAKEFSILGEHGLGSIFEIGARSDDFARGGSQYGNTQNVRGTPNKGWGFNRPSWNLISFLGNQDPRLNATVIFLGETIEGELIKGDASTPDTIYTDINKTQIKEIECYNQKVFIPGLTDLSGWGHNRRVLRFADVLLITAEALNENGKTNEALTQLNKVRARARGGNNNLLPDITENNQTNLRQIIWQERRRELAMEGHRFWDLVRTGQAVNALGSLGFVANKHELLPIPQAEIDLSEGTLTQNPNY